MAAATQESHRQGLNKWDRAHGQAVTCTRGAQCGHPHLEPWAMPRGMTVGTGSQRRDTRMAASPTGPRGPEGSLVQHQNPETRGPRGAQHCRRNKHPRPHTQETPTVARGGGAAPGDGLRARRAPHGQSQAPASPVASGSPTVTRIHPEDLPVPIPPKPGPQLEPPRGDASHPGTLGTRKPGPPRAS